MVSYEVSIGFVIITVLMCAGSLNLTDIVRSQDTRIGLFGWYWLWLFPMFVIFFISAMAETNRPPFDLPEAESELVAGYMAEYSSAPYLLFMLGEYVAIMTMCALGTILFLGGWLSPIPFPPFTWIPGVIWFVLKASFLFFMIAMVKAIVPRYRYDQLMRLGWKVFLPISIGAVVVVALVLKLLNLAPVATYRSPGHEARPGRPLDLPEGVRFRLLARDEVLLQAEGDDQLPLRDRTTARRASAASTRCAAIPTARSAASPASSARRSARRRRSPSRPARAATTARAAPPATTSTW